MMCLKITVWKRVLPRQCHVTNHVCQLESVGPDSGKYEALWDAVGHGQEPTMYRERNTHRETSSLPQVMYLQPFALVNQ